MLPRPRLPFRAAAAAAAIVVLAVPAIAQDGLVGVSVTPPRVEVDLQGRAFQIPLTFENHEDEARELSVSVAGLGHDLDGTPLFLEPALATEAVELSETEFTLAPGEAREVVASGAIPENETSLYAAVIALFAPPGGGGGQIESRSRIASMFLIRAQRPWEETVRVVDVSVMPGPGKRLLQVFAAVKNTGNVHVRPSGRIRIVKGGKSLASIPLPAQNIIPEYARRLLGDWKPPKKLTGRVKLIATTQDPAARGVGYVDFTPEGDLAVPGMKIGNLVARDENGPLVELVLTNTGTVALAPTVSFDLSKDRNVVDEEMLEQPRMDPGTSEVVQWRPGDLDDGVYLISAEVRFREQLLDQAATGLELESTFPPVWVIALGGGLLLLIAILLIGRRRRNAAAQEGQISDAEEAA